MKRYTGENFSVEPEPEFRVNPNFAGNVYDPYADQRVYNYSCFYIFPLHRSLSYRRPSLRARYVMSVKLETSGNNEWMIVNSQIVKN